MILKVCLFKNLIKESIKTQGSRARALIAQECAFLMQRDNYKYIDEVYGCLEDIVQQSYEPKTAEHLRYFINSCFQNHTDKSYAIWLQLATKEANWLEQEEPDKFYIGNLAWRQTRALNKIRSLPDGESKYLLLLEALVAYPEKYIFISDIRDHVARLQGIKTPQAKGILKSMRSKFPHLMINA